MRRATILCASWMPFSQPAITQALQELQGWRMEGNMNKGAICRDFEFRDFKQAMAFMNAVAVDCERMEHHPSWTNTYNRLQVQLTTHGSGNRVTQKDIDLARRMNDVFREISVSQ
ncbi:pterin-4-alpha-carbinolamine dehydratase [Trypanosoma cruzi]|uniref:4a-hydroxytetrahydrobiopterin dehydratase n=1 Tax=Trypanosoma cruzi (strain CL Brener) TaxID=353153 RepID=Q4D5E2_TRYCC|nr:pterin-4-alpha-carbinolamine dehydratase, putative [Trypanosoma cruzi]EAN87750.1 pterin-4-alpha-carbinolamine dehydratase, putative [Trypanosoma cruzi]RNC41827.1 pterin-4-alpha-carbinolamine dehydratase [Trypanosoma cruzi]|eukprot:XP_809601.1 pterin-4-alpha-carbinolamine dehydratase [Trypanosoma cruzi strain CL Brener]